MIVTVYAASSDQCDPAFHASARALGEVLARAGHTVCYGGGSAGSMGALAEGALTAGGRVIGVLPRFMDELEWGHRRLSELKLVESMHERKAEMLARADAVVALPGGCGTLEELFEAITWKRLGLFGGPVVMVNTLGFYAPVAALLDQLVVLRFLNPEHRAMWSMVDEPAQVLAALAAAAPWSADARQFAVVRPDGQAAFP
jgi:uncharacterized protein (TIGR00730 family)